VTLADEHCRSGAPALTAAELAQVLAQLPQWRVESGVLCRSYALADFRATMAFANALAAMIDQQDHHPEMTLSFNRCTLCFTTHSAANQVSRNDAICAARADAIFAARALA
jgi:4a-hydroxytetrahydrobiopterin dehydratase